MIKYQGLEARAPDQKKKQRSFQETPLLSNSNEFFSSSQGGNYVWN